MHVAATPEPTAPPAPTSPLEPDLDDPAPVRPTLRCAMCHDDLDGWSMRRCPGCRTLTHAECAAELGSACATLGCSGRRPSPVFPRSDGPRPGAPARAAAERPSAWLFVPAVASLVVTGVALVIVAAIAVMTNQGRLDSPGWTAAAVVAGAFHTLLLPGVWTSFLRARGLRDGLLAAGSYTLVLLSPLLLLGVAGRGDAQVFAAIGVLVEPFLVTLILGAQALVGRRSLHGTHQAASTPRGPRGPRVLVRARPLAFVAA